MAKKTTVSSAAASAATLSGTVSTQQDDVNTISTVGTSTSSDDKKPDEAKSEPSQGAAEGAGANAGSNTPEMTLADILVSTGTMSFEQLCDFVKIGRDLVEEIQDVSADYPALQNWIGSENPAGIVRELAEENAILQDIRKEQHTDSDDGKRVFTVFREVSLDNETFKAGASISLTKKQHQDISAANACDPDWAAGI